MNILIPDSWLREYLETKATPVEIMRYLSLSGPSVERIIDRQGEPVYDIEITTNRVDAFSVSGIAREAAVILPEYGFPAKLKPPSSFKTAVSPNLAPLSIQIKPDDQLINRIIAVEIRNIQNLKTPDWLKKRLEMVGQRSLNLLIDITNYVMWEVGHPLHIFDLDRMVKKKLIVRKANKREKFTTLDNRTHFTNGGEIIFDDGAGEIIDLPGIMGTANTVVTNATKNALLFSENSDPALIRQAAMGLSIRTQAAAINEKHPDPHLAETAIQRALGFYVKLSGAQQASKIYDHFLSPKMAPEIILDHALVEQYLGKKLPPSKIISVLTALEFKVKLRKNNQAIRYQVIPPSFRNDISLPVDLVEEIARITGYQHIPAVLPGGNPSVSLADPLLQFESDLKHRLKGYGFTESYTYSMISREICRQYKLDTDRLYKITNIYSSAHVYLRPILIPSLLEVASSALSVRPDCELFELANIYQTRPGNLPEEKPWLALLMSGDRFRHLRGYVETLFSQIGISPKIFLPAKNNSIPLYYEANQALVLDQFGYCGFINNALLKFHGISVPIAVCELAPEKLLALKKSGPTYQVLPKYPSAYEDLALVIPDQVFVGPLIEKIRNFHPLIVGVELIDLHKQTKTIRIIYQAYDRNLSATDLRPIRESLLKNLKKTAGILLKTQVES
jgi:phenylalanyl-tRNA synthetase beta chain